MALGDIVSSRADGSGLVDRVVEPSGRYVFRAYFDGPEALLEEVAGWIELRGGLVERWSHHMIAIDAWDEVEAQHVADYLAGLEARGRLVYETGRS
ncbi:DUF4265 domain-containing protein [Microlunatus antarcticus]|uniref:Uncharacterized protein n=1 Tax=Microlunatus antarcticus TaxID=53388 RepID=A0A7W5P6E4_9ACTN|nr:DUF4265 domain-containing protein [Microlunatus antarcticus]MBB3326348.1 hypothetical protein [Microlunatus antarcticus]